MNSESGFDPFGRSPVVFAVSVLLITAGVAANALIFTFVNTLLLRPPPVRDPASVVQVVERRPNIRPQTFHILLRLVQRDARPQPGGNLNGRVGCLLGIVKHVPMKNADGGTRIDTRPIELFRGYSNNLKRRSPIRTVRPMTEASRPKC